MQIVDNSNGQSVSKCLEAALDGETKAMCRLGSLYLKGAPGIEPDGRLAEDWLLKAAEAGDAEAMYDLSTLYRAGAPGIQPDIQRSESWYRKAIETFGPWG